MSSLRQRASRFAALLGLFVLPLSLTASMHDSRAQAGSESSCASAAITDFALEQVVDIDEIRVHLAQGSPQGAASLLTVETADTDRVLELHDEEFKAVQFAPAMRSHSFRISLFPSENVHLAPACVESVELLTKGASVFVYKP